MKKRYGKLTEEINKIEQEIESVSIRKSDAEQRIEEATAAIETLQTDLKAALVSNDQKQASAVEKKISELSGKIVNRDRLLIEGLSEKLPAFEKQLAEAKADKNKVFCKLSEQWLASETSLYNGEAKKIIDRVKRLLVAHSMLREIGSQEIYTQVLGPGYEFLPSSKICLLKDFNRNDFNRPSFRAGNDLYSKIQNEITEV